MALNFRKSYGNRGSLPEFREGSGLVQGLQNVGISPQHRDDGHSYIDVNRFENNWEDLDEEFSRREVTESDQHLSYRKHKSSIQVRQPSGANGNKSFKQRDSYDADDNIELQQRDFHINQSYLGDQGQFSDPSDVKVEPAVLRQRSSNSYTTPAFSQVTVGSERTDEGGNIGCCGYILWFLSIILIILTFPFSLCLSIKVVQEYERAVIFRLGRLVSGGAKGPGLFFIIPCIDSYTKVDLRTVSFDVPPQEVLTKDSVTVAVDAVVYYRIQNATMSITNVEDSNRSTRLLAATTLRNVLGTKNLSEILSDRESISHVMQTSLDEATDPWGVKVERVEVKDVRLPVQLQRAMAAEAEAAREARAKVIAAEGEQKASRALKEAADVMAESPAAIQLRYLQTLNTISAEKNSTIIFPLPVDLMQAFLRKSGGSKESSTAHL